MDATNNALSFHSEEVEWRTKFARRLKDLICVKGFSVTSLSIKSGVAKPTLYNYLNRRNTPTVFTLVRIAETLGCNVEDFLCFD